MPLIPVNQAAAASLGLVLLACGGGSGSQAAPEKPAVPARALNVAPLAGQKIAVLPLTLVAVDPALADQPPLGNQPRTLRWSDSLLAVALESRAPGVDWVLPDELRRMAHRAPSLQVDPDRMGQSIMGSPRATAMPDPLRSYARNLVALAGGRMLLIPAVYSFTRDPEGLVKVEIAVVLADARNGQVLWRTLVPASAASPGEALAAAYRIMVPLPTDLQ